MGYSKTPIAEPRFQLGRTVATRGATDLVIEIGIDLVKYLARHHHGDRGDLEKTDKIANEEAIKSGDRLVSKYLIQIVGQDPVSPYVITEWDRSLTRSFSPPNIEQQPRIQTSTGGCLNSSRHLETTYIALPFPPPFLLIGRSSLPPGHQDSSSLFRPMGEAP